MKATPRYHWARPLLSLLFLANPTAMAFRQGVTAFSRHRASAGRLLDRSLTRQSRAVSSFGIGMNWPISKLSMSKDDDDENFEREFRQRQKAMSEEQSQRGSSAFDSQDEHADHQAQVFDEMASFFASEEAVPDEVKPVLKDMAGKMIADMMDRRAIAKEQASSRPARAPKDDDDDDTVYRILDVGCGTGALFEYYLEAAEAKGITLHIHGLDLAPKMVDEALRHGAELVKDSKEKHTITAEVGDICDSWTPLLDDDSEEPQLFDLAVANACFGNFWDRSQALEQMGNALKVDGLLCITHPLGSAFVRKLHEEDASMVPHLLPGSVEEFQQLAQTLPLRVLDVVDKNDDDNAYYMATATKTSYKTLSQTMRFRGPVDSGYGRGGKKLGFPTANLPSRLFQGALQDVDCGVYFGWAVLEGDSEGRNVPHKAVVNVGFSPTFEGQENPEKIVEAHLIFENGMESSPLDPPDFYGEVMRLQLIGFIRPEMKFPSFPDLIAQITTDVADAKDALDLDVYQEYPTSDPFIARVGEPWVGKGGGDEDASWEFDGIAENG